MMYIPSKVCKCGIMQVAHNTKWLRLLCVIEVNGILSGNCTDDAVRQIKSRDWPWRWTRQARDVIVQVRVRRW
jgi:hypothetical protein